MKLNLIKTNCMKILKRIGVVLLILIAIPFIVALFVKKEYSVEREIIVRCDNNNVFEYIKFLKNQDDFSVWATMDPNMKKSYKGTDGKVGFISSWDSKDENVGTGEQEIIAIDEGKRIDFELRFIKPFKSTGKAYMSTEPMSPEETMVKWGFNGKMNYPTNIFLLFMDMEELLGKDLQIGLDNLKVELEK